MASVIVNWSALPGAAGYKVYQDDAEVGSSVTAPFEIPSVSAGVHKYEVAGVNEWGPGPKSDPVYSPDLLGKPSGVSIQINISVSVP